MNLNHPSTDKENAFQHRIILIQSIAKLVADCELLREEMIGANGLRDYLVLMRMHEKRFKIEELLAEL